MIGTTVINATLPPGMVANTFTKTGAAIFVGSLYGALLLGTLIFVWVVASGANGLCSCCTCCGDDDGYSISLDDEDGCCTRCVDSVRSSCLGLMCKWACLKIYMLCCGCSPRFKQYAELRILEMENDLEEAERRAAGETTEAPVDPNVFVVIDSSSEESTDIFGGRYEATTVMDDGSTVLVAKGKTD